MNSTSSQNIPYSSKPYIKFANWEIYPTDWLNIEVTDTNGLVPYGWVRINYTVNADTFFAHLRDTTVSVTISDTFGIRFGLHNVDSVAAYIVHLGEPTNYPPFGTGIYGQSKVFFMTDSAYTVGFIDGYDTGKSDSIATWWRGWKRGFITGFLEGRGLKRE